MITVVTMLKYLTHLKDISINQRKAQHFILMNLCVDTMTALIPVLEQLIVRLRQYRQTQVKVKVRVDFLRNVVLSVQPQSGRPAVNQDFNPDRSCMFDAFQLKCIPGADQECPDGFGNNDDSTCFFLHTQGCPEGYHSTDNDETGQCYSNKEGCNAYVTINGTRNDYVLLTDIPGKGDNCADPRYLPD